MKDLNTNGLDKKCTRMASICSDERQELQFLKKLFIGAREMNTNLLISSFMVVGLISWLAGRIFYKTQPERFMNMRGYIRALQAAMIIYLGIVTHHLYLIPVSFVFFRWSREFFNAKNPLGKL